MLQQENDLTAETSWHTSRFTGIFTNCGRTPPRAHDPDVAVHSGLLPPWGARGPLPVGGAGWNEAAAKQACLGEGIERLQAYALPSDDLRESSHRHWRRDEAAVEPWRWVLFHAEQYAQASFPFEPLTQDSVCPWVCFREALSGEPRWIPENMAFLFSGNIHRFAPAISTGLSCGQLGQPVLLRGLQEAIERDGIVGAWWESYGLEEFDGAEVLRSLDPLTPSIAQRILRPNLTYRFYRVASPFSSNITLVSLEGEDREGYCFSIGSACRETLQASWLKSMLEAIHSRYFVRYAKPTSRATVTPRNFEEHALYYSHYPEQLSMTALHRARRAALVSIETNAAHRAAEGLPELVERLGEKRPVLFRDMTPPGIAQEIRGWQVLKIVVPGLQPLHGNHDFPHLGGELWKPRRLGEWRTVLPHPFP